MNSPPTPPPAIVNADARQRNEHDAISQSACSSASQPVITS
jgi:hypothetical protein